MSYTVVQGDTAPAMILTAQLSGAAIPTGYFPDGTTAALRWEKPDGTVVEAATLDVVDLTAGTFRRTWAPGDTDLAGEHRGQLVVTRPDTTVETFPSTDYILWFVSPKL